MLKEAMGICGHTVRFKPDHYKDAFSLVRDYHAVNWDLEERGKYLWVQYRSMWSDAGRSGDLWSPKVRVDGLWIGDPAGAGSPLRGMLLELVGGLGEVVVAVAQVCFGRVRMDVLLEGRELVEIADDVVVAFAFVLALCGLGK